MSAAAEARRAAWDTLLSKLGGVANYLVLYRSGKAPEGEARMVAVDASQALDLARALHGEEAAPAADDYEGRMAQRVHELLLSLERQAAGPSRYRMREKYGRKPAATWETCREHHECREAHQRARLRANGAA